METPHQRMSETESFRLCVSIHKMELEQFCTRDTPIKETHSFDAVKTHPSWALVFGGEVTSAARRKGMYMYYLCAYRRQENLLHILHLQVNCAGMGALEGQTTLLRQQSKVHQHEHEEDDETMDRWRMTADAEYNLHFVCRPASRVKTEMLDVRAFTLLPGLPREIKATLSQK